MSDKKIPFPGDVVAIDGTKTTGVVTADLRGNEPNSVREHRVVYKIRGRWLKQWLPETVLTVLTPAYDIPLGKEYVAPPPEEVNA